MKVYELIEMLEKKEIKSISAGIAIPAEGFEYQNEIYSYTVEYYDDRANDTFSLDLHDVQVLLVKLAKCL